jgi:hypothetical protein
MSTDFDLANHGKKRAIQGAFLLDNPAYLNATGRHDYHCCGMFGRRSEKGVVFSDRHFTHLKPLLTFEESFGLG